jgi:hypothetical protein
MALTQNEIITPQAPGRGLVQFHGTVDGTATIKNLYVAGATNGGTVGAKVYGITAINNGATAHNVTLVINNSGGTILAQLNVVAAPANAGSNGTATPVAMMSAANAPGLPVDSNGNPYYFLNNGDTLSAEYATAQGTADNLYLYCCAADF